MSVSKYPLLLLETRSERPDSWHSWLLVDDALHYLFVLKINPFSFLLFHQEVEGPLLSLEDGGGLVYTWESWIGLVLDWRGISSLRRYLVSRRVVQRAIAWVVLTRPRYCWYSLQLTLPWLLAVLAPFPFLNIAELIQKHFVHPLYLPHFMVLLKLMGLNFIEQSPVCPL
jgi:hypothetical protein